MLAIIYFVLFGWFGPAVAANENGKITAERIVVDYAKEILLFNGDTREYVDCSAAKSPFVSVSLRELIGAEERTIYCRLRSQPGESVAFKLPARPSAPALSVDYANVRLSGKSEGAAWKYVAAPYLIEKVSMPDSIWKVVEKYPGLVGDKEQRLADVRVEIDAIYQKMSQDSRMSVGGFCPWFSTGLYAPPAEVITIKHPAGLKGKKIVCRIGASNSTLAEKHKPWKRLPFTFVERVLNDDKDTTRIYNPNGGNIYIIPDEPLAAPVTFVISGAVKSPDFVLGKTDPQQWMDEIQSSTVPFAELAGKRMIWSMPVRLLKEADDPVALTEFYDAAILHDYNVFHGLSDTASDLLHRAPDFAVRCVQDIQIHAGAAYASYPCMFGGDVYAKRAVSRTLMRSSGNAWGFFHEVGHIYQVSCWKWSDGPGSIGEVSNNLNVMYGWNRMYHEWHEGTAGQSKDNYQDYIHKFMSRPLDERNFEVDEQFGSNAGKGRLVPFCQLAQKYGWKLYAYLGKCARELSVKQASVVNGSIAMGRREFFCKRVCEYANADMRPFFDAWGIQYGPLASADMATMPPYTGEKFWEKWDVSLIPDMEAVRIPQRKLPDDNYDMKEGEIKRTAWKFVEEECQHAYGTDSPPENILDGSGSTFWATPTLKRPIYDKKPIVVIDMGQTETFDYIEFKHHNNGYDRLNCRLFSLEVKETVNDEWTLVGQFENATGTTDYKYHPVAPETTGRYLRLTLIEGFPEGGISTGSATVAEFKIGKSIK